MSVGETPVTVVGNLAADPELKYTAGGAAMARFTVASTPRSYDKDSGQWKDGTSMFLRCTAWRSLAENVATSLAKGNRVVVTGRLRQLDWQTDQGENRSMLVLDADEVGPSLRFATATPERTQGNQRGSAPAVDQWSTSGPAQRPATAAADDEPPF
ncbi:single-stranded DNA-binding protein [Streptomyces huiliensis]|uniref:single-stranded DNA-binding protein n=1 Tax=Streptomyces huiliensis TaxID=2876027 RepID=UPI001CBFB1ED|nr:single-stranded DNA-binding protein [Streptomyces huiliensis]MBZ4319410.1 single-stranded DNA-binding protein [Streptomyces huiliensis]